MTLRGRSLRITSVLNSSQGGLVVSCGREKTLSHMVSATPEPEADTEMVEDHRLELSLVMKNTTFCSYGS